MEPFVDACFRIAGTSLPLDHGYALFAALSRILPQLHAEPTWGVHPVLGLRGGPGCLSLTPQSRLKLRVPARALPALLALAGTRLDVDGHLLHVGIPELRPLTPAARLNARIVTVKGFADNPDAFRGALRQQLAALPELGQAPESVEILPGQRRVMRIAEHTVVGFATALDGLEAAASLAVQCAGLGGRRHMGAGVFVPPGRRA